MNLRPFIIDDAYKSHMQRLIDYAQANRITFDQMLEIVTGCSPPPGNDDNRVAELPFGYRVVFSIEENMDQQTNTRMWTRHLSISVAERGRCPNPYVVEQVAEWLGFQKLRECTVYIEDTNGSTAVNVISKI